MCFREEKKSQDKDKHESTKSLNKVLKNAMNSNKTKSILYMATKGNTIKWCMFKLIGNTKLSINTSLKNDSPSEIKSPSSNEGIHILVT